MFSSDPQSVSALIKLTTDPSSDVRDWAVFGFGVLGDSDSPEIREVLLVCLKDGNEDVCEEAAAGLGKRRDRRLTPALQAMLDNPEITVRVADDAAAMLEVEEAPGTWAPADYRGALEAKFGLR